MPECHSGEKRYWVERSMCCLKPVVVRKLDNDFNKSWVYHCKECGKICDFTRRSVTWWALNTEEKYRLDFLKKDTIVVLGKSDVERLSAK